MSSTGIEDQHGNSRMTQSCGQRRQLERVAGRRTGRTGRRPAARSSTIARRSRLRFVRSRWAKTSARPFWSSVESSRRAAVACCLSVTGECSLVRGRWPRVRLGDTLYLAGLARLSDLRPRTSVERRAVAGSSAADRSEPEIRCARGPEEAAARQPRGQRARSARCCASCAGRPGSDRSTWRPPGTLPRGDGDDLLVRARRPHPVPGPVPGARGVLRARGTAPPKGAKPEADLRAGGVAAVTRALTLPRVPRGRRARPRRADAARPGRRTS